MSSKARPALTGAQLRSYEELGFARSIPVLSPAEVRRFRAEVERTAQALGGVTRLDGAHHHLGWAWELAVHPALLDALEGLLGSNIILESTRLFYKHPHSEAFVGWHQDGCTQGRGDALVPSTWLALTEATAENGCLRVLPGSHRHGLLPHDARPDPSNLTTDGVTVRLRVEAPADIVLRAGEMSLHHPLAVHGSGPNRSAGPRIGFSATYTTPDRRAPDRGAAWVRGGAGDVQQAAPPPLPLAEALAAYRGSGRQICTRGA